MRQSLEDPVASYRQRFSAVKGIWSHMSQEESGNAANVLKRSRSVQETSKSEGGQGHRAQPHAESKRLSKSQSLVIRENNGAATSNSFEKPVSGSTVDYMMEDYPFSARRVKDAESAEFTQVSTNGGGGVRVEFKKRLGTHNAPDSEVVLVKYTKVMDAAGHTMENTTTNADASKMLKNAESAINSKPGVVNGEHVERETRDGVWVVPKLEDKEPDNEEQGEASETSEVVLVGYKKIGGSTETRSQGKDLGSSIGDPKLDTFNSSTSIKLVQSKASICLQPPPTNTIEGNSISTVINSTSVTTGSKIPKPVATPPKVGTQNEETKMATSPVQANLPDGKTSQPSIMRKTEIKSKLTSTTQSKVPVPRGGLSPKSGEDMVSRSSEASTPAEVAKKSGTTKSETPLAVTQSKAVSQSKVPVPVVRQTSSTPTQESSKMVVGSATEWAQDQPEAMPKSPTMKGVEILSPVFRQPVEPIPEMSLEDAKKKVPSEFIPKTSAPAISETPRPESMIADGAVKVQQSGDMTKSSDMPKPERPLEEDAKKVGQPEVRSKEPSTKSSEMPKPQANSEADPVKVGQPESVTKPPSAKSSERTIPQVIPGEDNKKVGQPEPGPKSHTLSDEDARKQARLESILKVAYLKNVAAEQDAARKSQEGARVTDQISSEKSEGKSSVNGSSIKQDVSKNQVVASLKKPEETKSTVTGSAIRQDVSNSQSQTSGSTLSSSEARTIWAKKEVGKSQTEIARSNQTPVEVNVIVIEKGAQKSQNVHGGLAEISSNETTSPAHTEKAPTSNFPAGTGTDAGKVIAVRKMAGLESISAKLYRQQQVKEKQIPDPPPQTSNLELESPDGNQPVIENATPTDLDPKSSDLPPLTPNQIFAKVVRSPTDVEKSKQKIVAQILSKFPYPSLELKKEEDARQERVDLQQKQNGYPIGSQGQEGGMERVHSVNSQNGNLQQEDASVVGTPTNVPSDSSSTGNKGSNTSFGQDMVVLKSKRVLDPDHETRTPVREIAGTTGDMSSAIGTVVKVQEMSQASRMVKVTEITEASKVVTIKESTETSQHVPAQSDLKLTPPNEIQSPNDTKATNLTHNCSPERAAHISGVDNKAVRGIKTERNIDVREDQKSGDIVEPFPVAPKRRRYRNKPQPSALKEEARFCEKRALERKVCFSENVQEIPQSEIVVLSQVRSLA